MKQDEFLKNAELAKKSLRELVNGIASKSEDIHAMENARSHASKAIGEMSLVLTNLIKRERKHGNGVTYDVFQEALSAHWYNDLDDVYTAIALIDEAIGLYDKNVASQITQTFPKSKEVFLVHGHDDLAKHEMARFIKDLGFEPIILHEQANSGRTIIEKIEEYSNVGFGVVLYTPCDVGAKSTDTPDFKARARQNVVFEHGFMNGKLGRSNVCAFVKGEIETPSDISGVVYVKMDDHGAWKIVLVKEMRNSGYNIDMNKVV